METKRDRELYEKIEKFKILNTSQIHKLIYPTVSEKFCRERLKKLADRKILKRVRYHIDQEFIYYQGKLPSQLMHRLLLINTYIALNKPTLFDIEYSIENLRADAYMESVKNDKLYSFFIEIHRNNDFNFTKYQEFFERGYDKYFTVFPRIIIVTDKKLKIPNTKLRFIVIKNNMSNIEDVYKWENKSDLLPVLQI